MIEAFTIAHAHHFQDAYSSQARLRHRVFVEQRGLNHPTFDGLEFDEFDTPSAVYLVWRDENLTVRGLARLLRTDRPYMLRAYWPHLVASGVLPETRRIWEVTRVCVDKSLLPVVRQKIFPELLCAIHETFRREDVDGMIGVTSERLLSSFIRSGIEWLGPCEEIEGRPERAFYVPTDHIRPSYHCNKLVIEEPVLTVRASDNRLAA